MQLFIFIMASMFVLLSFAVCYFYLTSINNLSNIKKYIQVDIYLHDLMQ